MHYTDLQREQVDLAQRDTSCALINNKLIV